MKSITFIRRILFGWKTAGSFLIMIAAFCNISSVASATTLTFEPGEGQITIPGFVAPYPGAKQYVEKGMTVNAGSANIFEVTDVSELFSFATGTSLNLWSTDIPPSSGTSNTATFSLGGAPFDVISVDTNLNFGIGGRFVSSLGSVVQPSVPFLPPFPPPFPVNNHIDFTQILGWSGITSFTMFMGGPSAGDINFGIDNLVFQASSVPEPSTLALLVFGIAGLVGCRRRELTGGSS